MCFTVSLETWTKMLSLHTTSGIIPSASVEKVLLLKTKTKRKNKPTASVTKSWNTRKIVVDSVWITLNCLLRERNSLFLFLAALSSWTQYFSVRWTDRGYLTIISVPSVPLAVCAPHSPSLGVSQISSEHTAINASWSVTWGSFWPQSAGEPLVSFCSASIYTQQTQSMFSFFSKIWNLSTICQCVCLLSSAYHLLQVSIAKHMVLTREACSHTVYISVWTCLSSQATGHDGWSWMHNQLYSFGRENK